MNLRLGPGQKLRAQDFARTLKVSRTPVREAFSRLEQERLVHRDSGWGYVVQPMTFKEILDLFKIREALEVLAALEAMPNLTDSELRQLKAKLDQAERLLNAGRQAEFRALCREFHMQLGSYSRADLLQRILLGINDRIRLVAAMQVDVKPERAAEMLRANRRILAALIKRDEKAVRSAVLAHIRNARNALLKYAGVAS